MAKKKAEEKTVTMHLIETRKKPRFYCGLPVVSICDNPDDWEEFNKYHSTEWQDVTCTDCLEQLYALRKAELNQLGKKLGPAWVI